MKLTMKAQRNRRTPYGGTVLRSLGSPAAPHTPLPCYEGCPIQTMGGSRDEGLLTSAPPLLPRTQPPSLTTLWVPRLARQDHVILHYFLSRLYKNPNKRRTKKETPPSSPPCSVLAPWQPPPAPPRPLPHPWRPPPAATAALPGWAPPSGRPQSGPPHCRGHPDTMAKGVGVLPKV